MSAPSVYFGTLTGFPVSPYVVEFSVGNTVLVEESDLNNPHLIHLTSPDLSITGTYNYSDASYLINFSGTVLAGTNVYALFQPASTEVIRPDPDEDCLEAGYQERPEDELGAVAMDMADEYPWRRDIVGGGELIDFNTYSPAQPDIQTVSLSDTAAVQSQTGAQYDVQVVVPGPYPPRFVTAPRTLDGYVPGQRAIAFTGTFLNLAGPRPTTGTLAGGLDGVMQPGWELYHFGLVQDVLVADPVKFFGAHHRTGLAAWFPFNEQPLDPIEIVDHSPYAGNLFIGLSPFIGQEFFPPVRVEPISPADRKFDPVRGNYLSAQAGLVLTSPVARGFATTLSGGFWTRPPGDITQYSELDLIVGPLGVFFFIGFGDPTLIFALRNKSNGFFTFLQQETMDEDWAYIAWDYDGDSTVTSYVWKSSGLSVQTAQANFPVDRSHAYTVDIETFGNLSIDIQDLRLWNVSKTQDELDLSRYHQPNPTACLYPPTWLQSVNTYDRYAVKVLPSGYVVPDQLPTSIIEDQLAWVQRYDYLGRYDAQSRYKETGIGSGNELPPVQRLGSQWDTLTATGTVAVSTWQGNFVGINNVWLFDNAQGTVLTLIEGGTSITGITGTHFLTGTGSPWPNPLQASNPCRDRIWVKGDDGFVWQVMLGNTENGNASFTTEKLFSSSGSYQPTGAHVQLSNGTHGHQLSISTSGSVYAGTYSGTVTSAPIYLYANEETVINLSGTSTVDAWVQPNTFGLAQVPLVPALNANGQIAFQIDDTMEPGFYRLQVTSGNIGKVDNSFAGFSVLITVGDVLIQGKLCAGQTGADFTRTDTFEFYLSHTLPGSPSSWLLLFDWSNALKDTQRGTARQLFISGVSLTRYHTSLWQVTVPTTQVVLTEFSTSGATYPTTPGGWLATITSWGTAYAYYHESAVYSANDTVIDPQPMSNKLTATTVYRREDIIMTGSFTVRDGTLPTFTSFGTLIDPCPPADCPTPGSFPTTSLDGGLLSSGLVYHPGTKTLWTPSGVPLTPNLYVVDTDSNTVTQTIDLTTYGGAWDLLYDTFNDQMVVISNFGDIVFINPATYAIISALTGVLHSNGINRSPICYDTTRGHVLALDTDRGAGSSNMALINCATRSIITSTTVAVNAGSPFYCPATDVFYFSLQSSSTLKQVDPTTLAVSNSGIMFPNANETAYYGIWISQMNALLIYTRELTTRKRVRVVDPVTPSFLGVLAGADVPGTWQGVQQLVYNTCDALLYVSDAINVLRFDPVTYSELNAVSEANCDGLSFVSSKNLLYVRLNTSIVTLTG